MKTLLLLRHAQAANEGRTDLERPLTPEGRGAADRLGRFLATAGTEPAVLAASPAVRARETLARVAAAAGWPGPQQVLPLYEVMPATALDELRRLPADADSAMLVGHQPTWSELVSRLLGGGAVQMPTGAVACLALEVRGWGETSGGVATLQWLVHPRLLAVGR